MHNWVTFEKKCSAIDLLSQINKVSSSMAHPAQGPSQMDWLFHMFITACPLMNRQFWTNLQGRIPGGCN